jgi:hypothetical protein
MFEGQHSAWRHGFKVESILRSDRQHSAFAGMVTRNDHIQAPGRSYTTHRQALTATAAVVIHTTGQLWHRVKYWLLLRVVDMVRYTVEQCLFLYDRMWNVVPLEGNFVINFPGSQFQAQQASMNLFIKPSLLGHSWTRNLLKSAVCFLKKKNTK